MEIKESPLFNFKDIVFVSVLILILTIFFLSFFSILDSLIDKYLNIKIIFINGPLLFASESLSIFIAIKLLFINRLNIKWSHLGLRPVLFKWILISIISCFLLQIFFILLIVIFSELPLLESQEIPQEIFLLFTKSTESYILSIFFGAVTIAVTEELLFRGILYKWMRANWDTYTSIIASSIIFTVVHPSSAGSPINIFIMGLALAWFYERTGSLYPSIVLHLTNNVIGISIIYSIIGIE